MQRDEMLSRLDSEAFDLIIIGGGATGLGIAVDASGRGLKTLLLEKSDFAKGSSSRSTKLIHGGLRYLQQGNISLVREALKERGRLRENAPHLVKSRPFLVPSYHWWEGPFYGFGLKIYDALSGSYQLEPSHMIDREELLEAIPQVEPEGLRGGVIYTDGQFDDARLAIALALTAADEGAVLINYMNVTEFIKEKGETKGVVATDEESGEVYRLKAKVVVNATGIFSDLITSLDDPSAERHLSLSQGTHLVFDSHFFPGDTALLIPHTKDGRVLFVVPWLGVVLVGTTDTGINEPSLEPKPREDEVEYLLEHIGHYLAIAPQRSDILSQFAGLRPLVKKPGAKNTSQLARDHVIFKSDSGLVTIVGGKWTTYRKMAEDLVDSLHLNSRKCTTKTLKLHGYNGPEELSPYGSDLKAIRKLIEESPELGEILHPDLPYLKAEVIWSTRYEMARTVEDILSRRTRALLLNAAASISTAPVVARLMAGELGRDEEWERKQVAAYGGLAKRYLA